jgi:hypothetical protein
MQSKDTRYIQEPLQLPLVQINLNECNHDTDIIAIKPTLQIMQDKAQTRMVMEPIQHQLQHTSSIRPTMPAI